MQNKECISYKTPQANQQAREVLARRQRHYAKFIGSLKQRQVKDKGKSPAALSKLDVIYQ
jgi:hypothetical protein